MKAKGVALITRTLREIISEDDFLAAGEIPAKPTTVDGVEVKYSDLEEAMTAAASIFSTAFEERDRRRREQAGEAGGDKA